MIKQPTKRKVAMQRANIRVGNTVEVTHSIDLQPYTVLKAGEKGEVVDIDDDGPAGPSVTVRLKRFHPGLTQFGNTAYLVDPELASVAPVKGTCGKLRDAVCVGTSGVLAAGLIKLHAFQLLTAGVTLVFSAVGLV